MSKLFIVKWRQVPTLSRFFGRYSILIYSITLISMWNQFINFSRKLMNCWQIFRLTFHSSSYDKKSNKWINKLAGVLRREIMAFIFRTFGRVFLAGFGFIYIFLGRLDSIICHKWTSLLSADIGAMTLAPWVFVFRKGPPTTR